MITHLRQSMLKSYDFCPGQFYMEYILELHPYSPHFDFGTKFHAEAEKYHKGKKYNKAILNGYVDIYPPDLTLK